MRLPGLLLQLGFSRKEVYRRKKNPLPLLCNRPWDRRNEWTLKELYLQALSKYKARIKTVHPDYGGTHDEAVHYNQLWKRIKYLLKRRGLDL